MFEARLIHSATVMRQKNLVLAITTNDDIRRKYRAIYFRNNCSNLLGDQIRSTVGGTPVFGRRTDPVLRSTFC